MTIVEQFADACAAALDWVGPDGDHIHDPERTMLLAALERYERQDAPIGRRRCGIIEHRKQIKVLQYKLAYADMRAIEHWRQMTSRTAEITALSGTVARLTLELDVLRRAQDTAAIETATRHPLHPSA